MRLTKKRLLMINSALAYWETMLIDDPEQTCWKQDFKTYAEACKTMEATRDWVHQELSKREGTN